ncbi:MAG: diaminopimelate decarboxylase [Bacteroidetes bacterium]|jgi:diaminopimelate decarboxylase|nr:diaminopimelate decarboxylase [Bacteroidota bacterium]
MALTVQNKNLFERAQWGDLYGYPLYVYDGNLILNQYDKLKSAFAGHPNRIHYACKANSNLHILKLLAERGSHLDVVSVNEGRIGELAGFSPKKIHFTPNGVSIQECLDAIDRGYSLSLDHIESIKKLSKKIPGIQLCIRINPAVKAGGHEKISVGHDTSKFGLSLDQLPEVIELQKSEAIRVVGMHIHTGSDIGDVEAIKKGAQVLMREAKAFSKTIEYLDFGGGFKVSYFEDDSKTDVDAIGSWLSGQMKAFEKYCGHPIQLVLEPGKFLVSAAGYFLAEVSQIKINYGTHFAFVNAGFNHFMRPMYYEAQHRISVLNSKTRYEKKTYDVVGYLCETDTFARNRNLPRLREGDVLVFHNAGAYSFSMASQYNMRLRPAEVLMLDGASYLIRAREQFSDLLIRQVPLRESSGSR